MPFLDQEKLVASMIKIYCKQNHKSVEGLCDACSNLFNYAQQRLEKCPYGKNKPVCSNCRIHCYKKEYKEKIKEVMRFSGPKIIFYKPVSGIKYLIKKKFLDRKLMSN
jgi:hypothetical protein